MAEYPERAEADFSIVSRFPWEEHRPPIKGAIEKDQRINDEVASLLQSVPAEYRREVGAKVRRIILILKG